MPGGDGTGPIWGRVGDKRVRVALGRGMRRQGVCLCQTGAADRAGEPMEEAEVLRQDAEVPEHELDAIRKRLAALGDKKKRRG